jgi:putative sigma-54 modulation protein
MGKVERQIKKHVAKHKQHKGNNAAASPLVAESERAGSVIRTQRVAVKPMSVDEAIMHLKLLKNEFLLFKNADSETLSVIYRRKDGNYGLIEPEPS